MKLRLPLVLLAAIATLFATAHAASTDLNGQDSTTDITLSNGESLTNTGSTAATQSGTLSLSGDVTIGGPANITVSGPIIGTGSVTKTTSNTLYLGGNSTYTGNWFINQGTLILTSGDATGTNNTVTLAEGTTLLVDPSQAADKTTTVQSSLIFKNNTTWGLVRNDDVPYSDAKFGNVAIEGYTRFNYGSAQTVTLNGILSGAGTLELFSPWAYNTSTFILSNNDNTFSGTIRLTVEKITYDDVILKLRLGGDTVAQNTTVELFGRYYENNNLQLSKSILEIAAGNAAIKSLTGNTYSILMSATAGNTLTIKEGGSYLGAFDNTNTFNIVTNGDLILGYSASAASNDTINSTFKGTIGGTGGLTIAAGGILTLSGGGSYSGDTNIKGSLILSGALTQTGRAIIGNGGTLTLNSGGSFTNTALVFNGGQLVLNNGATQTFSGTLLSDGTASSLTVSGTGSALNTGAITGTGTLIIQGTDSITGSIQADHLFAITFTDGTSYYNAQISGANIIKGSMFGDLTATSNDGAQNYLFRNVADLTMTNGAGTQYTIGGLAMSGTGKTLTLGAGGLKINGNLLYDNTDGQTTTISGGPLDAGNIIKTGTGDLLFNSVVTAGSLSVQGNVIFTSGGSISNGLSGTGTIKLDGMQTLSLSGNMGTFNGSANLAAGSLLNFNATGVPTFTNVAGTGTFKVDSGQINIVGPTCSSPAADSPVANFTGPAFHIGTNGAILVDHRGLTGGDSEVAGIPYAPRTIKNLTGSGTLYLKTVGGEATGDYPGHAGTSIYVGEQGFTGKIVVQAGFLGFYAANWGNATIVLDGGALGNGTKFSGQYQAVTHNNNIEVTSAGTIIRLFGADNLTLGGTLSGTGTIRRTDAGTLIFSGDTSAYTGNMNLQAGNTTFNGPTGFGTLTVAANATLNGSTTLNGLVYSSGTLVINTPVLTIGTGGITTTNATLTQAMTVSQFKASGSWILGSNITLNLQGSSGFNMDTQGNNVTLDGQISFAEDAGKKITKTGAGTLTITQNDLALTGPLAVNGGTLRYTGSNFSSSAITFANGGILNFSQTQTLNRPVSGSGIIQLDGGTGLNIAGQVFTGTVGLTMNGNNTVSFTGTTPATQQLGTFSVNSANNVLVFNPGGNLIVTMANTLFGQNSELTVSQYDYSTSNYLKLSGLTPWQKLDGVTIVTKDGENQEAMVDNMGRLVKYQADIVVGNLVGNGNISYTYTSNTQYYGALAGKVVDFTQPFLFESGASNYGFTLRDDRASGSQATSFTVSTQLTNGPSGYRTVSILGQDNATDRTVTLTNTANNFTGELTISNAVVKAAAANPGAIGNNPVTILGIGNTVNINENATVDLATGPGSYVYANNFSMNGNNALLKQTAGQHTLTGAISVNGSDGGPRTIQNTLENGDLTLAGTLTSRGNTTLVLRTQNGENSRIILSLNSGTNLNKLSVEGHVVQTKNSLSALNGIVLGDNASYNLTSGSLAAGIGITTAGAGGKTITMGNGTSLSAMTDNLIIGQGVTLAFAQEQGGFTLDTGNGTINLQGLLGTSTNNNSLTKKGQGTLSLGSSQTVAAALTIDAGTLSLQDNVQLTSSGDITLKAGTTLNMGKGSSLSASAARTFTFNGSLTGEGSLSGVGSLTFIDGARYAANMTGQSWGATFKSGSTFSGHLLQHTGNIVFEDGSHIVFDTTLPVNDSSIGISTLGGATVRFNGTTVSATTDTPEIDWDATQSYIFTLVKSQRELLGRDGTALTADNLGQSISVGKDGWGVFLQGELSLSEDSKELLVTVTRNGNVLGSFAQTGNQLSVANALDYAMDNFSSLGLRGTELGDVIQFFNKMGQNIATEAPEALGMVGGLSNYQALAGQRTDMMRHLESVRQRANAGKGLVGISAVPNNAFWAEGTQGYSRIDGTDNSSPGYTAQSWGAAIGMDYLSGPNYSLGIAFAYSDLKVDSNQYAGQTRADNYYVDLYGRWESGNWNGVVVLSGGTANVDVKRTVDLGGDIYHGKGSMDGTQIIGMAEVAYNWQWEEGGPVLQPYLGMAVGQSKLDGYTESGIGNAGLVLDEQKQTVAQASLGVRLFKQNIDREMQYETSRWELRAGLVEEFGDTDFVTRSSFIGLPGYTMSTTSEDIGRTGLQIGAGFSKALGYTWSVFGDVNGEFRNGQTSMNSTLGLRYVF